MKNYFYKFDNSLKLDSSLANFKGSNVLSYLSDGSAITYNKVTNIFELTAKFFPKKIFEIDPHVIYYAEVPGPGFLDPHRDHGATTVANFYFNSNSAITTFYEPRGGATARNYGLTAMKADNIYRLDDLTPVANFQAMDGESYLLDVTKIHSVCSFKHGYRSFINMQWYGVDIDTIYSSIL